MKKLALLSLIVASCAAIAGFSITKSNVAEARAASVTYPADYGSLRRVVLYHSVGEKVYSITVKGGSTYNAQHHAKDDSIQGSFNEVGGQYYVDIPATTTEIVDISFDCYGTKTSAAACEFKGITLVDNAAKRISIWHDGPTDVSITYQDASGTGSWANCAATYYEGCYSCLKSSKNGYEALAALEEIFWKNMTSEVQTDFLALTINDISGYEYGNTTTRCTIAAKRAMMQAMKAGTYGNTTLTVVSTRSTANSYLWVIAIAGTAAIASITTIVIAANKKKKQKEN